MASKKEESAKSKYLIFIKMTSIRLGFDQISYKILSWFFGSFLYNITDRPIISIGFLTTGLCIKSNSGTLSLLESITSIYDH
jgi:hypothetical protein